MKRVLVTGAGGFIGHHLVSYLKKKSYWVRGADLKYPEYEPSVGGRLCAARPAPLGRLPESHRWNRRGVRARRRHGRNGFHFGASCGDSPQQFVDQHSHPRRGARERREALPLYFIGLRLSRVSADRHQRDAAQGRRRVPGSAAGRVRLGEADDRASMHSLPRRLRTRDAHRALPQYLRSAGHLGRWSRESARGVSAARYRSPSSAAIARSRSGATASRRARSATSTIAWTESTG